ncbi:MAG: hypothetical protein ABI877_02075 [Gemmatimonadaceae bacterium]
MSARAMGRSLSLGAVLLIGAFRETGAQASIACNAGPPRAESPARALHPANVEARYGDIIAARRWMDVLRSLQKDIDTTFATLEQMSPKPQFTAIDRTFQDALSATLDHLVPALQASLTTRATLLHSHEFLQFEPFPDMDGAWRILQMDATTRPLGIVVPDSLKPEEYEAICWAGRSVSRLLGGVNFETIPGALAHISELAREWERYRWNGPDQLMHELALNRLLRGWIAGSGDARYHPSRFDIVALHPFAGVELQRRDGAFKENESMAFETGGVTYWFNGWKHHVGASWVLAYDRDGRIGRGPLVRVSTLATAGLLWRRDAAGVKRKSFLLTIDLLRVLKSDETAQATQQTRSIVGKLLEKPLGTRK